MRCEHQRHRCSCPVVHDGQVVCQYCGKKLLPRSMVWHHKYFCGPNAARTLKQAKQEQSKRKATTLKAMKTLKIAKDGEDLPDTAGGTGKQRAKKKPKTEKKQSKKAGKPKGTPVVKRCVCVRGLLYRLVVLCHGATRSSFQSFDCVVKQCMTLPHRLFGICHRAHVPAGADTRPWRSTMI